MFRKQMNDRKKDGNAFSKYAKKVNPKNRTPRQRGLLRGGQRM
jgi:hypothetical protein